MQYNKIGYINTLMRYHLHINPDELSDEQWAQTFKQLAEIRKTESEAGG